MAEKLENNEVISEEQTRPEPPKDADGNPIAPPEGFRPPLGGMPPEPPKDADGNPIAPPEGIQPPACPGCGENAPADAPASSPEDEPEQKEPAKKNDIKTELK